jgi:membrane protein YqaA with SNARE-associated domain
MQIRIKKRRSLMQELNTRHKYNIRSGLYSFMTKNIIKLILILIVIVGGILALDYFFDLGKIIEGFIQNHKWPEIMILFLISETILGWIPPDFFIVWAQQFQYEFLMVTVLATVSYVGGINAYYIGKLMLKFPKIKAYIEKKNEIFFIRIRKWGGLVVIFAALFPLPYATTATVAGMVGYPFRKFLLYGLTRYIRFFLYASVIFKALDTIV